MTFSLVQTQDGSYSCLDSETGELCHNRVGAYTEALKNYTEPSGLVAHVRKTGTARVLDVCYGLGYNTWVLVQEILRQVDRPFTLSVVAIEYSLEILRFLPSILEHSSFDLLKSKITPLEHNIDYRTLECCFDTKGGVSEPFQFAIDVANEGRLELTFYVDDLRAIVPKLEGSFDAIFHDPFSPQKMPELWTVDLFREYARLLAPARGKLLTYSAAAAVRGGLMEAGFQVGKTLALGEKQGGTLATLAEPTAEPLSQTELAYLESRAGLPYRDIDFRASREQIVQRRLNEQQESSRPSGSEIRKLLRL